MFTYIIVIHCVEFFKLFAVHFYLKIRVFVYLKISFNFSCSSYILETFHRNGPFQCGCCGVCENVFLNFCFHHSSFLVAEMIHLVLQCSSCNQYLRAIRNKTLKVNKVETILYENLRGGI